MTFFGLSDILATSDGHNGHADRWIRLTAWGLPISVL